MLICRLHIFAKKGREIVVLNFERKRPSTIQKLIRELEKANKQYYFITEWIDEKIC